MKRVIVYSGLWIGLVGCGVRGDPVPPDTPPPLGRGEANFSKATQQVVPPSKKKKQRYDETLGTDEHDGDE